MMGPDVAPAGVLSQSTRSGGAGAPLAGTMTCRQELADDAEPSGSFGSAARCRKKPQWSAERRASVKTEATRLASVSRVALAKPPTERDRKRSAFPGAPLPLRGR